MRPARVWMLVGAAVIVCGLALLWVVLEWPQRGIALTVGILVEAGVAAFLVALLTASRRPTKPRTAEVLRCPRCSTAFAPPAGSRGLECPVCHYRAVAPPA